MLIHLEDDIDGFVQDCGISGALAMELPKACSKPSRYDVPGFCIWWSVADGGSSFHPTCQESHWHVSMRCATNDSFQSESYIANVILNDLYIPDHGLICLSMMTSSNGSIFGITGHLCGEFTVHRGIPHTKACDMELWCLLWSAPE